jgi:asparagine synthase (glutamine-hydrolysing)
VSYRDIGTVFPAVVRHAEQPMLRAAPAPLFLLSGLVRESGYKVVVTGEGADEMLAGYDIFREATVRRFLARDPDSELRREILFSLYPWMKRSPTRVPAFAEAFFSQAADPSDPAFSHRPRWRASSTLLRMLSAEFGAPKPGVVEAELLQRLPEEFHGWRPLEQAQYLEWRTLLSGYILAAQGDRMLMSHSVEGRFPFLDPEVMRFAASLPPRQKLMGMDEKHILKRAFGHRIPDTVRRRPKQPYRAPDAASFAFAPGTLPWLDALLAPEHVKETGLFVPKAVEVLLRKCREQGGMGMSNTDNMRLLAVISTMLLAEECVGSAEAAHEDGAAASGVTAVAR